mgnify:CR=1 FL=1|jgi:arylsulfatase A-like enzyme
MPATYFAISTRYLRRGIILLCLPFVLIACGGGGGSGSGGGSTPTTPDPTTYSVGTTFIKGLVNGANCELFEVTAAGVKSTSVATGTTTNGVVSFGNAIEYQGTGLIECLGGSYTDEATGLSLMAPLMRAVVTLSGDGDFVVSPLTEIATQLAEAAGDLAEATTTFNDDVAAAFGLDIDITTTEPTDLSASPASANAAGEYGTVLALISQLNDNETGSLSDLLDDLATDLEDDSLSAATLTNLTDAVTELDTSEVAENINDAALADVVAGAGIPIEDDNPVAETDQPNILIILSDDQGVDSSAEYDYSLDPPITPVLSALAEDGVIFQNTWATPACSSTRAGLLTGKHGINNGVPTVPGNLDEEDEIIYEYLANNEATENYASAYIGKWHLNDTEIGGESNPVANGIPYFAGPLANIGDYNSWNLTIDGDDLAINESVSTEYNTSELTRLAEDWIDDQDSPWFLTLAYNAPHGPVHLPDSSLHTRTLTDCSDTRECYLAMIEALDHEVGNLLDSLSEDERNNTLIIYIGDNGTPNGQRDPLVFTGGQVKNTLFEGGLRVPMFASGAGVTRTAVEDRLVTVTDLYATVAEIAGAEFDGAIYDSVSFAGYLESVSGDNRLHAYSDWGNDEWAIRSHSHHLISDTEQTLYRLDDTGVSHSHVEVTDAETLFELQVEATRIRGELANFSASPSGEALDITDGGENGIYNIRATTCARYVKDYTASVTDEGGNGRYTPEDFVADMSISVDGGICTFSTDGIPNHHMQDTTNSFATEVSEQSDIYQMTASPEFADAPTFMDVGTEQGIYLNGVKIDIFAAACLGVSDERIGCGANTVSEENEWRFDPMFEANGFGTDSHNAHTQPSGAYHYHGSPNALFDGTGATQSGTVGFAADGFPIYGVYVSENGQTREVLSSYQLKSGNRPTLNLGGSSAQYSEQPYNGAFRQDYEYIEGSGDLDECNGMYRDGSYGYYVTNGFPYIVGCFQGTPDDSFLPGGGPNFKLH